jgi:trans-aconitate 2-methyltransferase
MVEAARQRLPGVAFEIAEIADWSRRSESFDVILSNAALQWVPGHASLLPALLARLRPGGSLAVQMPDSLDEPAHRLMRKVAAGGPWAAKLADMSGREDRHDIDWYYRTLRPACTAVDIWRTTYHHPLAGGARAVVEWFESTGLRPYLQPLDETERRDFLAAYEQAVGAAYPAMADGTVLLPFPRLFFVAIR